MTDEPHIEMTALAHEVVSFVLANRTVFTDAERNLAIAALRCLMDVEAPSMPRAL